MRAIDELDTLNKFAVGRRGDRIVIRNLAHAMEYGALQLDEDEALVLAAYLVATASGDVEGRFSAVYSKVVAS